MIGIVAFANNGVIGKNNSLPWRCPDDLKHFKSTTLGKTIIMGRTTYNSIGKPLPGRNTVILTKTPREENEINDLSKYLEDDSVCLCGGSSLYSQFSHLCSEFIVTHLDIDVDGDSFFDQSLLDKYKNKTLLSSGVSNDISYRIIRYY